jgi:glycolate oxidase FAD binding subunit
MNDNPYITETLTLADQAAVAEAVRNAGEKNAAVYPVGGGTMLDYGVKPTRPGVGLSLAKLNRVIDYPAADLTITVEAGITIGELNKCLAAQRQRLPVDVPQPDRATVGGAVAVNAAGPRRYVYGTMRDYLLGYTAVDGSGTTFSGGGRVVKNAAGYNMCRLMAGSLGTLGVMTQVTLMVRPLAEASVFFVCDVPDFDVAEKLLAGLVHSSARPTAIEFVAGRQRENDLVLGPVLKDHVGRLYVGFEGPAAEVDWMVEQLRTQWASTGATEPMLVPTSRAEPVWRWLTDFSANVQINVLPGAVTQTIAKVLQIEPDCAVLASAGDGVIRVRANIKPRPVVAPEGATTGRGFVADDLVQLRAAATAAGGKLIVQKNPDGLALSAADVWGPPGSEVRVMQAIKERFDPKNILNPGRFVFD